MTEIDETDDDESGTEVPDITETDEQELQRRLAELKQQHRDLDDAIESLEERGFADQLQLRRLKKQKLFLKDEISKVEDLLLPDIIA